MNATLRRQAPTLALIAIVLVATPWVRTSHFWLDNSVLIAIFSMLALSVGMSYGHAGILSLATASFAAMGAYATAILSTRYGVSPYLTLVPSILLPMLVAYPVARVVIRLSPLPLSIATLVLGSIVEIGIGEGGQFTGGHIGLSGLPPVPIAPSAASMHVLAWVFVAIGVYLYCNIVDSGFGRAVDTARHDPLRATADGVDVPRTLALFFAIAAGFAGTGGWLYAHYMSYIGPDSLNNSVSIQVLLMAIVGGVGTRLGPVIGAGVLLLIANYLPAAESQGMVYGFALIFVLLLAPDGLIGGLIALVRNRQKRRAASTIAAPAPANGWRPE